MPLGRRSLTTVAAGLLAVLAAGCGSSQGLLSSRSHDALSAQLLAVRQAVLQGDCAKTSDALAELDTVIDGLPPQTNGTLARNLRQGATVVRKNATRQCHRKRPKPPVTTSTTQSTTTTQTTTSTTSSTPAPPTSTSAPPATSTSTPPPSTQTSATSSTPAGPPSTNTTGGGGLNPGGNGNSGGNGNGNGGGNG